MISSRKYYGRINLLKRIFLSFEIEDIVETKIKELFLHRYKRR